MRTTDRLNDKHAVARRLLLEEIARVVADARGRGETLRVGYHARLLSDTYPHVFSIGRIMDELVLAASLEKVPAEISRPEDIEPHF